jgi:hypothetical protein
MSELMQARTKVVEDDLGGFGYGRIEYREEHGDRDSSRLEIYFRDNSNDPLQTMEIVGSIEIEEFFKLIDRVRREAGEGGE